MEPHVETRPKRTRRGPALAKPLAPEDVRLGDFVAVLSCTVQWPSWLWNCGSAWDGARSEVVRTDCLPPSEQQTPLKVLAACLPFVLVKDPGGDVQTLDLRQVRLARLDEPYARCAWRKLKRHAKRSKKLRL